MTYTGDVYLWIFIPMSFIMLMTITIISAHEKWANKTLDKHSKGQVTDIKGDYVKGPFGGTNYIYFQFRVNKKDCVSLLLWVIGVFVKKIEGDNTNENEVFCTNADGVSILCWMWSDYR